MPKPPSRRSNLRTSLPRRQAASMHRFDRLPPALRAWLAAAPLPFSPIAAERIWHACGSDPVQALARLDRAAQKALHRDTAALWGNRHPSLADKKSAP